MVEKPAQIPKYTQIRDTYTVTSFLGEGAFGGVYQVRHKYLGLQALKIFHPGSIAVEQEFELFSEAANDAKGSIPNEANCKNDFRCILKSTKKTNKLDYHGHFNMNNGYLALLCLFLLLSRPII